MSFLNIDVKEFKKDEKFIGNGTYHYNEKENKIIEFYKYNSALDILEVANIKLKENEYLLKIRNDKIICIKAFYDNFDL